MKLNTTYSVCISAVLLLTLLLPSEALGQAKDFRAHTRGILHQTIYNTGEVGRPAQIDGFEKILSPSFEWPGNSATIVDDLEYSGQHNTWGGGVWLAANIKGKPGPENRLYAFCGGTGKGDVPELPDNLWSFPYSIERIENFPVLDDGRLNAAYDPSEAEEIIIASWGTNLGIKVTRTSRAWSYPDYDDIIIYEYEFEYNGDTDGNPATVEMTDELVDVFIGFDYSFGVSLYGHQRWHKRWKNKPGIVDDLALGYSEQKGWFDADYWLSYCQDGSTFGDTTKAGKPEPRAELFLEFAETSKNGGGLGSPQAAGFAILYYDTEHLAIVDFNDPERNESELVVHDPLLKDDLGNRVEIDPQGRILQPYNLLQEKQNFSTRILQQEWMDVTYKEHHVYLPGTQYEPPHPGWTGRGGFDYEDAQRAAKRVAVFGPYTVEQNDVLEFSLAEAAGYGGEEGKVIEGGYDVRQFNKANSWHAKIVVEEQALTEDYIRDYGYPDYVNSDVISISDAAHKAWEAYRGESIPFDETTKKPANGQGLWPEDNPKDGRYTFPVPPPAPMVTAENTEQGPVVLRWLDAVESFTHPNLTGPVAEYKIYRGFAPIGPWTLVGAVPVGANKELDEYVYEDIDASFKVGETKYYAVVSVDANGNESGRVNKVKHTKSINAVSEMGEVVVVPNPFYVKSGFEGEGANQMLGFYGLPEKATINIYSFAGQLIQSIEHDKPEYTVTWVQITRNFQELASGMYYFVVKTPNGQKASGKFMVIK